MQPRDLVKTAGGSFLIAVGGMMVPLAAGLGLGWWFIPPSEFKAAQSLFLATSLAITAVPVAVKVLMDLGKLHSKLGQVVVSAALVDDVLSLLLLAILTAIIRTGEFPGLLSPVILAGEALLFFGVTALVGTYVFPIAGQRLKSLRSDEIDFTALLVVALAFAMLAEALGMHFILGAFLAGIFFVRRTVDPNAYEAVKARVSGITSGFLAPLFFASIGMNLNIGAAAEIPGFVVLLVLAAFFCKLLGAGLPPVLAAIFEPGQPGRGRRHERSRRG
jgi:Kef-type K+ transport system membrane component KefB